MEAHQDSLFYERIEDAIDEVLRAAGGRKKLAAELWPTKAARDSHNRLDACLNPDRPEKLSPSELLFIAKKGRESGCHALMHYLADECGYDRPRPRSRSEERRAALDQVAQLVRSLERITRQLDNGDGDD